MLGGKQAEGTICNYEGERGCCDGDSLGQNKLIEEANRYLTQFRVERLRFRGYSASLQRNNPFMSKGEGRMSYLEIKLK